MINIHIFVGGQGIRSQARSIERFAFNRKGGGELSHKLRIWCAAVAVALAISLLFSGCSLSALDAQSLMRPPRPTGERAQIHDELEKSAGANPTLKYPSRGEYRSAIIMHSLVSAGQEDAIAFYQ